MRPDHLANGTAGMSPHTVRRRILIADSLALIIGAGGGLLAQAIISPVPSFAMSEQLVLLVASVPGFAIGAAHSRLHRSRANDNAVDEAVNIVKTIGIGIATILILAFIAQYKDISRLWVTATAISMAGAAITERFIARRVFDRLRETGQMRRRIVIAGTDQHARALLRSYETNPRLGYEVVGLVGESDGIDDDIVLGGLGELTEVLDRTDSCGVVVSLSSVPEMMVNQMTRRLTDEGYHVALSSGLRDIDVSRLRTQSQDGQTLIYVEPVIRHGWRAIAKRLVDLALAITVLVVTAPIHLAAIVAIKATSAGPAYFRQVRVGRDGEAFTVLKLRTMGVDAEARKADLQEHNEADGPLFKMKSDPRITPVGRWLRKLSIDELPQLFCVLAGTMSMVGPRPALPDEVAQWDEAVRERLRVPPGLTGMWQVSGRSDSSFEQYKRLDLYYVDNWSLSHDLKICARTVAVVLTGRGAS